MNTLALALLCLAPALQDGWQDTHRVHLRNGNFLDGRLIQIGEKDILFRWNPGVLLRIKLGEIKGDIEEIKIRTLKSEPKKVPLHEAPTPDAKEGPGPAKDIPKRDPSRPESDIGKLLTRLLSDPQMDWDRATKEILALGTDGAKKMIAEVPAYDADRTNLVMVVLDMMRDKPIEPEIAGLLSAKRADLRASAVTLLANRGATGRFSALRSYLKDPAPQVRMAAIFAMTAMPDSTSLEAVADLATDPDAGVRSRAMRGAEDLSARTGGDNELAQRWLSLAGRGPAGALTEMVTSLGRLGERAGQGFPTEEVRSRLTDALSDRDVATRCAAAYALSGLRPGDPSGDAILAALATERETKAIVSYCDALGRLRLHKGIEPLIERLREDSNDVRTAAQRALEKISGNTGPGSDYEKWMEWHAQFKGRKP